jgi:predicted acyl esterase
MRWSSLFLAALLTAGCFSGSPKDDPSEALPASQAYLHVDGIVLSQERFQPLPVEEVWTPSSVDGAMMHTVLWRPDTSSDPAWKAPTILIDTPYRTSDTRQDPLDSSEEMGSEAYDWLIHELVPRGYAIGYKDIRGTGESGGCLQQTSPIQWQDGYDVIEDLASRPWSSGKVGMFGKSYLAEAQYGAAILQPPHLTTIVPIASVSGQYEWNFYDGVPLTLHSPTGTGGYIATSGTPPGTTPQGLLGYPSHHDCDAYMMQQAADLSGDWNQYWEDRELRIHMADITASVLYVHGLQDWNVRQVALRDSFEHIPAEKREVIGQWHHDHPDGNTFREEWSRTDWRTLVHAWYDHELLGLDNGILERLPPVQVQDSLGAWRAEAAYPPTDAFPTTFHLGDGVLSEVPVVPPELAIREDDESFLRSQGLPVEDQSTDQATELVFTSAPLVAPLRFSGWPVLAFNMTLTDGLAPDPDETIQATFAADLLIAGCDQAGWINEGFLSARHKEGVRNPADVAEGSSIDYRLRFSPGDTVVPTGCAIELRFASSNADSQPALTFWSGVLHDGTLTFPSVDRDLAQVGLDVPMQAP